MYGMNQLVEAKNVQVVFCNGAEIYRDIVSRLGFGRLNIDSKLTWIPTDCRVPRIDEIEESGLFSKYPHAFLTIARNFDHTTELCKYPIQALSRTVPIVYYDNPALRQEIQSLINRGARAIGTSQFERAYMKIDDHHPIAVAILAAASQ